MNNETDSNTSLSEQERKRQKLHKKLKKKAEKRYKKQKKKKSHKERKRSHNEVRKTSSEEDDMQIQKPILSQTKYEVNTNNYEEADAFGPALPPHFLNKNKKVEENKQVTGPIIPKELLGNLNKTKSQKILENNLSNELHTSSKTESEDDRMQGFYGPIPVTNELEMTPAQLELEQRALELKMAAMDGVNSSTSNQNVREEWMLELPDVGLKGGLAALNHLKRAFHQGKEKPDFSDRSSWTKTPNSRKEQERPISSKKELELRAHKLQEKHRDAEQETIAKEYKKKREREESLVEMHQKKMLKEEKKKLKALKKIGAKPERRPFTRDVDLKLNKIDRNQTKQIVDKAKILNTKFSSGQSKYL